MKAPLLLLALLCSPLTWAERWPESAAASLATQPITKAANLEQVILLAGQEWQGSSQIWLLDLQDGTRGVFRSEDEPWGSQAEIAGYRFSRWLQLELVPPTIARIIQKSEWPQDWPFPQNSRQGSLQLYQQTGPPAPVAPDDQADMEVLSYIMGRYDNHSGNLIFDRQGQPCLVDFENSLEIQKTRYGEISYVRRGQARPDLPSRKGDFPYEQPQKLVHPSLAEIQAQFSPWWVYWTQGMQSLHQQIQRLPDHTVNYVLWENRLWVQARANSRHPAYTNSYHDPTMRRLEELDAEQLRAVLPDPYGPEHISGMLERRDSVVKAWKRTSASVPGTRRP